MMNTYSSSSTGGIVTGGSGNVGGTSGATGALRLKDLQKTIRYCQRLQQRSDDEEFTVIGIYRYLRDPSFYTDTNTQPLPSDSIDWDIFDVLLTDGVEQMKCLLAPVCNRLVQTYELRPGRTVRLNPSNCVVHLNEQRVDCSPFVIINHLELSGYGRVDFSPEQLPFCDAPYSLELLECPLVPARGCYMSLWNNEDPFGSCWKKQEKDSMQNIPDTTITVKQLAQSWKTLKKPYPALIVRVLHRARIHCFAKHDKKQKWPFQLQLVVADNSGVVSVVGWNRITCDLYNRVTEGSLLLLREYTVRNRYALMAKPHYRDHGIDKFDLEIVLNTDIAVIRMVETSSRFRSHVPSPKYLSMTRQEMRHLDPTANGLNLDFAGVVCHVGCYMRQHKDEFSSQFWSCRWVHLFDSTSFQPVRLLLYSTSQPEEHHKIVPGVILLATQLRLVLREIQNTALPIGCQQEIYLTTTTFSQVSVFEGPVEEPFASLPFMRDLNDWRLSKTGKAVLQSAYTIAGYEPCSTLPHTFEDYSRTFTADKPIQPTQSTVIPDLVKSLSYREHKQVNFFGYIASVAFHHVTRTTTPVNHTMPIASASMQIQTRSMRKRNNCETDSDCSSPKRQQVISQVGPLSLDIDPLWREISHIKVIGSSVPHSSFFARKYCPETDLNVIKQSLLMPSETSNPDLRSEPYLEDLPVVDWLEGYFVVTVLGVNDDVAINGFLPLQHSSGNLQQMHCDCRTTDPAFVCLLNGQPIEWPDVLATKTLSDRIRWLLQDSKRLYDQRLLFVLDFYKPDADDLVEVSVIRGYTTNPTDYQEHCSNN